MSQQGRELGLVFDSCQNSHMGVYDSVREGKCIEQRALDDFYLHRQRARSQAWSNQFLSDFVHVLGDGGIVVKSTASIEALLFFNDGLPEAILVVFELAGCGTAHRIDG